MNKFEEQTVDKNIKSGSLSWIFSTLFIILQIQFTIESASGSLRWGKEIITIGWLAFILGVFIYFFVFKGIKIKTSSILFFLLISSINLISILIHQDFYFENFLFINAVISGFLISNIITKEEYLRGYVNAIVFYSIFSIVATYIILPLHMSGMFAFFPTYENVLGTPFVDMWLSYSVGWDGVMRNQGIFREPGVFQFYILVALSVEMFFLKHRYKNICIMILAVTLITTFSTVGLMCMVPLLLFYVLKTKQKLRVKDVVILIGIFIVAYMTSKSNDDIFLRLNSSFSKLVEGNDNISFKVRFESIINNIKMSFYNPIFGSSFVNGFHYIQRNFNSYGTNDITGTFFSFIMALGYPIGILIMVNFYRFCSFINRDIIVTIAIFTVMFISINTQNLVYSTLIWTFLFIPYASSKKVCD